MSSISIEEAEKIATDFVEKKRGNKAITVNKVTRIDANKIRVSGTYTEPQLGAVGVFDWEVKIGADKTVYEYNIP
jgi:hypothetical protein